MPKTWYGLAKEFVGAGHRASILARKFPGQPDEERVGELRIIRTTGFAQGTSVGRDLAKDLIYATNLLPRLPPADILVTNDFWVPALASRFRRSAGAVVVCAARFPKGQYFLYEPVARIVAISTAVRSAIADERPALARRTVVIPLPVERGAAKPPDTPSKPRQPTLLYVGRIHPEKGIELLLQAFAIIAPRFREWRLRIVGPVAAADGGGGEQFDETVRLLARGLNVEFAGPVFDRSALAAEYATADLFCYPSIAERGEAFGVAPLESMAAGVPAVVSALECFGDFVRDGENGWVFDHRAAEADANLAEALARAMRDDETRSGFAERARADTERFSFAGIARQYLDEFERILVTRPKGRG
jgi:glycosyltransferase involved in cell wall biosynthesis